MTLLIYHLILAIVIILISFKTIDFFSYKIYRRKIERERACVVSLLKKFIVSDLVKCSADLFDLKEYKSGEWQNALQNLEALQYIESLRIDNKIFYYLNPKTRSFFDEVMDPTNITIQFSEDEEYEIAIRAYLRYPLKTLH